MCVGAEDQVDVGAVRGARGGEVPGQGQLAVVGGVLPLGAPVQGDHDHVGARPARGPGVLDDPGLVDEVDGPGLPLRERDAVGVVGVGEVGDLGRSRSEDGRRACLLLGACRAGVPDAHAVEGVEGAADAVGAVVQGVVGGGGAAVVAGGGEGSGHLGRGFEGGVAGVGAVRAVDGLHVAQGDVGAGDDGADPGEHRPEVVAGAAGVEAGPVDDRAVREDVTGGDQCEGAWPGGVRCRASGAGFVVSAGLAGGACGEDDGQGQGDLSTACEHAFTPLWALWSYLRTIRKEGTRRPTWLRHAHQPVRHPHGRALTVRRTVRRRDRPSAAQPGTCPVPRAAPCGGIRP